MAKKKPKKPERQNVSNFIWFALIIFELAGIAVSIYLTILHYRAGSAACDINQVFDCGSVVTSKYSEIFHAPISWLGVMTYLVALIFTVMGRYHEKGRVYAHSALYVFAISIWCVLYSMFLAGVSTFILKAYCTNCIALYFVNVGLLLCSWVWSGQVVEGRFAPLWADFKDGIKNIWVWAAASVLVFMVVGSSILWIRIIGPYIQGGGPKKPLPPGIIELSIYPHKGPLNAPVQIVEFTDLKCPYCKQTHYVLEQARRSYGEKFVVYLVQYPLDQTCNPELVRTVHPNACLGAFAARCAQEGGKFWEYVDYLFEHQSETWDEDTLVKYAGEVGLNRDEFRTCFDGPEARTFVIEKNVKVGVAIPITHTPTLFFNGVEVPQISGGINLFVTQLQKALSGQNNEAAPEKEAEPKPKPKTGSE